MMKSSPLFVAVVICGLCWAWLPSAAVALSSVGTEEVPAKPLEAKFNSSNELHHHHEHGEHPVEFLSHHAVEDRQQFIVNITRGAWRWYKRHRWGTDRGRTILAAMPTLWLMDLKEEFASGREWIEAKLSNRTVLQGGKWVTNTVGDYVGSLLSCYALTGDQLFLDKAREIADRLDKSYNFTIWDRPEIELPGEKKSYAVDEWARSRLEYAYLTRLTGDQKYLDRVRAIDAYLKSINYEDAHLKVEMLAAKVKSYIQSNGTKPEYLEDYKRSVHKALTVTDLIRTTEKSNLTYLHRGAGHMSDDDCALGAILSLGADALEALLEHNLTLDSTVKLKEEQVIAKHRELAGRITETCHLGTANTKTGLTPTTFMIKVHESDPSKTVKGLGEHLFEPSLAESYLVLYRDTHEERYRDWAWELTKALFDQARTEDGQYGPIADVQTLPPKMLKGRSAAPLFRGIFKYLYLIYSPEERLPLEQWVLTVAGHPLPVLDRSKLKV